MLLIRRANEWSSGDLVLRQQKSKKAHFTESRGFVLLVVALVVAVLPFGLEAIGEATGLFSCVEVDEGGVCHFNAMSDRTGGTLWKKLNWSWRSNARDDAKA